jgi:hypothetical protein
VAATASIKILKQHNFRGAAHVYSNRYHFTNGAPADAAKWLALTNAIINAEKLIYRNDVTFVEAIGYAAGSELPVYTKTDTTVGTLAPTNYGENPLEVCALLRYSTDIRTSRNHPVYLFNYIHPGLTQTTATVETLNTDQKNAITTYGAAWITGFSDGAVTHKRAGPNGAVALGAYVSPWLTHRDFPT